jgi:hypothetical protein
MIQERLPGVVEHIDDEHEQGSPMIIVAVATMSDAARRLCRL